MIDLARDELRLAGVLERLSGRWGFVNTNPAQGDQPFLVDVPATNEALVMRGWRLDDYAGISPGDPQVPRVEALPSTVPPIRPDQLAVILLCGGLGSRGRGQIHPLLLVKNPNTLCTRTLLDLQLDRLADSPLASATVLVLGSLLNETPLRRHLNRLPAARRPLIYMGGLAPRLMPSQRPNGPPIIHCDPSGRPSYNPTGHLDALRWLVVSGALAHLQTFDVILVASYSNFGRVFTAAALKLAAYAAERGRQEPNALFVGEVVARPRDKWAGSMLVTKTDAPGDLRLVKYGYGRGQPCLAASPEVLMSTNTLYFSVASLRRRLCQACPAAGLPSHPADFTMLLRETAIGQRRAEAGAVFDMAFPVEPLLTRKHIAEGVDVLQAERDLDQLSLLPGPPAFQPIEVSADRAVSIKLPTDLDDPLKRAYLFGKS
ncbi:MAG: hypothetical protein ACRERE_26155 [Candidatus Entotheonellia bacterium]